MSTIEVELPFAPAASGRLLAAAAPDHATHQATHGRLPEVDPRRFLAEIRASGLTGRGGAGFPTAVKLAAVAAHPAGRTVVVANGGEGEPASAKDRQLLLGAPHLVLDGVQLAARVVGAGEAYLYVRRDAAAAVRRALAERTSADHTPVHVVEAAGGFVSGQETAVVSRLNGGPALPVFSRQRVTERGVGGRPTLVQNVETLAHLALIARHGGAWFASTGSEGATGTFLATVHPLEGGQPRVWEVPHGLPLARLLATAGSPPDRVQAVLVGGYHGTWLPLPSAAHVPLCPAGLRPFGSSLGAGVMIPLAGSECGLRMTARIVAYLAAESARQCGPCQFGLPNLAGLMSSLAAGTAGSQGLRAIREAAGLVAGRGACHHPDGTARLVRSALTTFEQDAVLHTHGRCLARIGEPYGGDLR
jgi:NADH:ubiquinone oxidoreductase subunit F (NADH-binding)